MFFAMLFATLAGSVWAAILLRIRGPICLQVRIFRGWLVGEWWLLFGDRVYWWGGRDSILLYLVIDRGGRRGWFCIVLYGLTLCLSAICLRDR